VTFALLQLPTAPDQWRDLLAASLEAVDGGADLWPQVAARATGLLAGHFTTLCLFESIPVYQALKARNLPASELVAALRDPAVRESIVSWEPAHDGAARMEDAYRNTFILGDPPDYEPGPERSVTAVAAATGRRPLEVAYDAMLEGEGEGLLYIPILNYASGDLEPARQMLMHPRSAAGLGDGGAHCGVICDSSQPTFMLTHWTRDRTRGARLPLEMVVKKQTYDTASLYGLGDRGTLTAGKLADVNVIDYERLQLGSPKVIADLPAGGRRLVQDATGYVATVKTGVTTFDNGTDTGRRPGVLLRGAR
jgi:N-acyl-D-aspartate/D-glutamate deacylase